jgi:hypothetical protein
VSDNHTGLPHDLPDYVPNWPAVVKVKATVYRLSGTPLWYWAHNCPHKRGVTLGHPRTSQLAAFEAALKHARGCW